MATASWVTLNVDDTPMQTYVATPDGQGPFPAIVFAMHIGGLDEATLSYCDRLAKAGYVTAAPDLYHRGDKGIPFEHIYSAGEDIQRMRELVLSKARSLKTGLTDDGIVRDMNAAAAYLKPFAADGGRAIGVVGFCMGGRVSYLVATRNPKMKAMVTAYGSDIFKSLGGDGPTPLEGSRDIACPVLGIFGNEDRNPSPEDGRRIQAELAAHGIEHSFHYYDGAGHGFMNPFNVHHYNETASEEAWVRLFSFLEQTLKTPQRV